MKEYIKQIYSEGFATIFYLKPINYLKKRIYNKKILNVVILLFKLLYTLCLLGFIVFILYSKLK